MTVAALYVDPEGVYAGLTGVEIWDERRDARLYVGPWPVVAHPPCNRWSTLAVLNQRHGYMIGDDGGCFFAALDSVRAYGGVLEHPAYSFAWTAFQLPPPTRGRWNRTLLDPGWTTEVSQGAYGHPARKATWLYYVGPEPPAMDWSEPETTATVGGGGWANGSGRYGSTAGATRIQGREASATPERFRDALLDLARLSALAPAGGS